MSKLSRKNNQGFSLVELVIVVVIIAIIGAIAVPRMSRGSKGAADSALVANLAIIRNAIEMYAAEHNGLYPTLTDITAQLTTYTDIDGNDNASKDSTHIYGPYLRAIPKQTVGPEKGENTFTATAGTAGAGWVYTASTGVISANTTTQTDDAGTLYSSY